MNNKKNIKKKNNNSKIVKINSEFENKNIIYQKKIKFT